LFIYLIKKQISGDTALWNVKWKRAILTATAVTVHATGRADAVIVFIITGRTTSFRHVFLTRNRKGPITVQ